MNENLRIHIQNLSDERLFEMLENRGDYVVEALQIAEEVLKGRGLSMPEPPVPAEEDVGEAPLPKGTWLKKPILLRFIEEIFFSYRDFFRKGFGLAVLMGVFVLLVSALAVFLTPVYSPNFYTGGSFFDALTEVIFSYDLRYSPAFFILNMFEFGLIGTYAVYVFRQKRKQELDNIMIGGYFSRFDGWQFVVLLGSAALGGIFLWQLSVLQEWFVPGFNDYGSMGGYSGIMISSAFHRFIGNMLNLLSILLPIVVTGTLVGMALARGGHFAWIRRGWRHVLQTLVFIFLWNQLVWVIFSSFRTYFMDLLLIFVTQPIIAVLIGIAGFVLYFAVVMPAIATVIAYPFRPEEKDYAEGPKQEEDFLEKA